MSFQSARQRAAELQALRERSRRIGLRHKVAGANPELATAYRLARELDVASFVHVLGAQEEVIPLLSIADVFLLPSAQESFGLAALEAMACQVPVVASTS